MQTLLLPTACASPHKVTVCNCLQKLTGHHSVSLAGTHHCFGCCQLLLLLAGPLLLNRLRI